MLTRWDCRRYAREAYDAGVRYFGGCCGFEPYHMREVAEEVGLTPLAKIWKTSPSGLGLERMIE